MTKWMTAAGAILAAAVVGALGASAAPQLDGALYSPADTSQPRFEPARVIRVHVYTCYARSRWGRRWAYGYWTSPYHSVAVNGALRQCAIRTPPYAVCHVTRCR